MPKRKQEDDYEKLLKKFKKLEKKVRRRCRSRSRASKSKSPEREHTSNEDPCEVAGHIIELLGDDDTLVNRENDPAGTSNFEPDNHTEPPPEPPASLADATMADPTASTALDSAILELLGDDPTISNNFGPDIHKDLAVRLQHIAAHGLSKELRKELTLKYLLPSNCTLINAPALNAEIKVAVSDLTAKRDKNIEERQKQMATAISCISQAINGLISNYTADKSLINLLMDSQRILCDLQYSDTVLRKNFILSSLKKEMKEQLLNTRPDSFLFGENLSETIKTAKAINISGAELKTPAPKPQTANKKSTAAASTSRNLNWKGPYPARKQQNPPKMKEPPPSRSRPSSSSRNSQQQRTRSRR